MKPATSLPWFDCRMNWVQPGDKNTVNSPQHFMRLDSEFALHACNAYPRLVAELKRLCVEIPKQLGSNKPMSNALLRKLGEDKPHG